MPALKIVSPSHRRKGRRWPDLRPLGERQGEGRHHREPEASRGCLHNAFTLLELLLVLAIVAVLAAVAAPRYGRASARYRADLAARRIAADLCLAQSCAKAASASRTVSFSQQTESYQLLSITSPDGQAGDYTVCLSAEPYRADLVSADFGGGSTQVVFNGWGLPANGGTVVVAAGSEQRTVVIDGQTAGISTP